MMINDDGDMIDQSGLLLKVKNTLLQEFEPVQDPRLCDSHYTTMEIFDKIQKLIPSKEYSPQMVSDWLHEAGFSFYDFGSLKFEWLLKRI